MDVVLPSVAPVMIFRSFILLGFFTTLFGWLQYKFQWQSVGDLAVYFDAILMNHNPGAGGLRDVQMGAILAANKRLLGYIIIAGLGVLTFTLVHSFGTERRTFYAVELIDRNSVQKILNILKRNTVETHEINKKLFAAHRRHFKERHAEATAQIPNLIKKLKQVDGFWNKVKVVFKYIPQSMMESIKTVKRQNRELRELRHFRDAIQKQSNKKLQELYRSDNMDSSNN